MALLKGEIELIDGMNASLVCALLSEVYTGGKEAYVDSDEIVDSSKITILKDRVIYDGNLAIRSDKRNIASLNVLNIPLEVTGNFICAGCENLTTLEGAPCEVGGSFYCNNCDDLSSLEGSPRIVPVDFACTYCESITSLKGGPQEVGHNYYCEHCDNLISLDGAEEKTKGRFIK